MQMRDKKLLRKWSAVFVIGFIFLLIPSAAVIADSPVPGPAVLIIFEGKPQNAVYADLLVPADPDSADFLLFSSEQGARYSVSRDSEIAVYSEEGYYSYTFHFAGAASEMELENRGQFYEAWFNNASENLAGKAEYIKIALLDQDGNILGITERIRISGTVLDFFNGVIHIDGNTLEIKDDGRRTNPYVIVSLFLRIAPRVFFSVMTEVLAAFLFRIKPLHKIVRLNIITQLILTIFMTASSLPYRTALAVGESAVYLIEIAAVLLMYKNVSRRRLTVYTVTANTASLLLGILLNHFRIFRY